MFVFFIKNFGISAAYALMHLPVPYFCLFSRQNVRGLYLYFRRRLGYSWIQSSLSIYRSYYVFGQTLVDKIAISSGMKDKYTYEFDGIENLHNLLNENRGGLLISAHVGNFELAQYFFKRQDFEDAIRIVITDQDHAAIKDYLGQFLYKRMDRFIVIKNDMSHVFEIGAALAKNEIVCITGDRYLDITQTVSAHLLGAPAQFPKGPFQMGARLNVPVVFVNVMRSRGRHYHLYARNAKTGKGNMELLLSEFTEHLQWIIKKYPFQWFNFYDFWHDDGR